MSSDDLAAAAISTPRKLFAKTAENIAKAGQRLAIVREAFEAGFALGHADGTKGSTWPQADDFVKFMAERPTESEPFRTLRKRFGISQTDIAELCGVTHTAVYLWERGEEPMPTSAINALAVLMAKKSAESETITGADLRDLRKKLGMRQKDLAVELGISINTLTQWEWRASKPLSSATVMRIKPQLDELRAKAAAAEAAA